MRVDPTVIPGLLLLAAEFIALAAVGFVVARVALRQDDDRVALAQGLVVGLVLWGLVVNVVQYVVPGLAGAAVGWGGILTLGAVLAWRAREQILLPPRTVAAFVGVVLALFLLGLASRQLLPIPDMPIHLGLAAAIRAGVFPPELPWSPGAPLRYHHGPSLMVGLLMPPFGPNLAFVSELLGVYAWVSYVLAAVSLIAQRGSWVVALILAPLLLTIGVWTTGEWEWEGMGGGVLQIPVPAGLPAAGLRASLSEIYWPLVGLDATFPAPIVPDIWKPEFTLGYALALVVFERVARAEDRSWPAVLTLGGLVGFLGLLVTTLVPAVGAVWGGTAALRLVRSQRDRAALGSAMRSVAGLALAVLLLLAGGGLFTGFLDASSPPELLLGWHGHPEGWLLLGVFEPLPGGVALLGIGPVALAGVAVLLDRRNGLVLALAVGVGLLALGWLLVSYPLAPWDVNRLAGHARNFALVSLLLALATRLPQLWSGRRRFAVGVFLVGLIAWPRVVEPVRHAGLALGNGIELANAGALAPDPRQAEPETLARRTPMPALSDRVATYIRDHTATHARVLAGEPPPYWRVFLATGRPNAAGFAGVVHQIYHQGPEYFDALGYLEPAAIRRLEIDYVYATDDWVAGLPARAQRWLADPGLFQLLVRDGVEALYLVRPAFFELDVPPHPESFEALRTVPASTTVYLTPHVHWMTRLRVSSALSHAQLFGPVRTELLFARSPVPWAVLPLAERVPDLVVLPTSFDLWVQAFLPSAGRRPIWSNDEISIYAPDGAGAPIAPLPPVREPPVTVQVTEPRIDRGRLIFHAAFTEHAPDRWTGQDWVIVELDDGPWPLPARFMGGGRGPEVAKWIGGLLSAGSATARHTYEFDVPTARLAVRNDAGAYVPVSASDGDLGAGSWVLAIRLRHEWRPGAWRDEAFIPVLRFTLSEAGEVVFAVFDDVRADTVQPGTPATP
ncbi:MAG: hypothetical protein OXG43_11055 [Chloroflexi bacterium]|nr:hypothetical protein [Chloroflexota bacterium]